MRKLLILVISLFVCLCSATATVVVNGPDNVEENSTSTYFFDTEKPLGPTGFVHWTVTGGTKIYSDDLQCVVQWDSYPHVGKVEAYDNYNYEYGEKNVNVYAHFEVHISPENASLPFGTDPSSVLSFYGWVGFDLSVPAFYHWQSSVDGVIWTDITDPTAPLYATTYFRCIVTQNDNGATTETAVLSVTPLDPGFISLTTPPAYGSQPVIGGAPATGGYCFSISYKWKMSFENGPWQLIGATEAFPGMPNGLTGTARFQRSATCGNQVLLSNILTVSPNYVAVNAENQNYLRVNTILVPDVKSWEQADRLPIGQKLQTTTYFDGLSRTIQQVSKEVSYDGSSAWNDFVTHVEYDAAGRAEKSYLSFPSSTTPGFFKTAAATEQPTYIRGYYGEDANAPTWSKVEFENSPLSRPTTVKESGSWWGDNSTYTGIKMEQQYNEASENVRIWDIGMTAGSVPISSSNYGDGKLGKQYAADEKDKKVLEYTDYDGRTILKKVQLSNAPGVDEAGWLCTYYVYDDFGRLRYVIPPKAVEWLAANGWSFTAAGGSQIREELCFWYEYDERGRMVTKHSPGAGQIKMVYDKRDRLVLTQDENQFAKTPTQQWSFMVYDEYDRTVATGLFDKNESWANMQVYANGLSKSVATISAYTGTTEPLKTFAPVAQAGACSGCTNLTFNTVSYYDRQTFTSAITPSTNFSFLSGNAPNPQTSVKTFRVNGMPVGSKVRVIDGTASDDGNPANDQFMVSTTYYNEDGLPYQSLSQNIKGGTDVSTVQFEFAGKAIATHESHTMPGTSYIDYQTRSYRNFDKLGRPTELYRQYGANAATMMYRVKYDPFGRVEKKTLSPAYNSGAGIESLEYSYNLHGQLTGINRDYALSTNDYAQWDHYFGMYLGYDNRAGLFATPQYNGQLSGQIWKTQGGNTLFKWDYTYDAAGRFTSAAFTQKNVITEDYLPIDEGNGWYNSSIDCSVSSITYDANGNLLTMVRKGIRPGNVGGVVVDNLAYHYQSIGGGEWTNKLDYVNDIGHELSSQNGSLGDFKDANTSGADYDYDANGNTVNDRNKNVKQTSGQGITWNYMDKPQVMRIDGKSTVSYIYDATGAKLGKKVTPVSGLAHTTWYMGSYLYEEDATNGTVLKYILHEEGRIRLLTPQNTFNTQVPGLELSGSLQMPDAKQGALEWMLKDQQGSTRVVLTEEVHREFHLCKMEDTDLQRQEYEERNFGNVDNNGNVPLTNEVRASRTTKPPGWGSNNTSSVAKLKANTGGPVIGPNMFLKVMAGDYISASAEYYYETTDNSRPVNIIAPFLDVLIGNFNNGIVSTGLKNNMAAVQASLSNSSNLLRFTSLRLPPPPGAINAFLGWVLFDENFNFVQGQTLPVSQANDGAAPLILPQLKVPKNGYAFVFLCSRDVNNWVYFANFNVTHERGRILEENTYYPDGLKISGLCAKAFNKLPNEFGYQGNYSEEEEESGYDEFALRTYDPTIGRWLSTDPYDQFASPYLGMGNDPVNNVDPDGGMSWAAEALNAVAKLTPIGNVTLRSVTPAVGQFSGTAQGSSVSASSSGSSGSPSAGALNSLGNAVAGALGQYLANKIFPLPQAPDARNLQQPLKQSVPSARTMQPPTTPTIRSVDIGGINDPSDVELPDVLKYGTAQIRLPAVREMLRRIFGGAASEVALDPPSNDWITPMWRDLTKKALEMEIDIITTIIKPWLPSLPPYPTNPLIPPAPGWEWRGRPGSVPGSKDGSWYNPGTKESLRPDLDHPAPIKPHWDYKNPDGTKFRWYPDGILEEKAD